MCSARGGWWLWDQDADGNYRSAVYPGMWLDPDALLAGDLDALTACVDQGLASPVSFRQA
jgi:hypothetical protein